jgi:hypothetical protein
MQLKFCIYNFIYNFTFNFHATFARQCSYNLPENPLKSQILGVGCYILQSLPPCLYIPYDRKMKSFPQLRVEKKREKF